MNVCEILLQCGASMEKKNSEGETLLVSSVCRGDLEMVEFLIDHNASVYEESSSGETLFICAAQQGHIDICEFLMNYGICVNEEDHLKMFKAGCYGNTKIGKLLVEYGADKYLLDFAEEMKSNVLAWKENYGKK